RKVGLEFNDGSEIWDTHDQDCCETHYLDWDQVTKEDLEGLEFDLSNDNFLEKVEGYGIRLKPINGHPVSVPGYGYNNGYYSTEITLYVKHNGVIRQIDVSDCQVIE